MDSPQILFRSVAFAFHGAEPMFLNLNVDIGDGGNHGCIVAIVGPNGVGKSTFCALATGEIPPLDGDVTHIRTNGRIATVPQRPVIFEALSIRENLEVMRYSRTLGETFNASRVDETADRLGLHFNLDRLASIENLSGGEIQRLMLARTRMVEPSVLVLDEPCSALDNLARDNFLKDLRDLVKTRRILTLLITHNWSEARLVANQVIHISRHGKIGSKVSSCSVREFESTPPTIDALYTAHWPLARAIRPDSVLANDLNLSPQERQGYVGIFIRVIDSSLHISSHDESIYRIIRNAFNSVADPLIDAISREARNQFTFCCCTYDNYGSILRIIS